MHVEKLRKIVRSFIMYIFLILGFWSFVYKSDRGGWFVYQIYKTRYTLGQTVQTNVISHSKKADYIYINDPDFQLMYGE
jgi:hypothetical protein